MNYGRKIVIMMIYGCVKKVYERHKVDKTSEIDFWMFELQGNFFLKRPSLPTSKNILLKILKSLKI